MPSFTLTDVAHDLWIDACSIGPAELGLPAVPAWSIAKRTLRGGRRDGVDLIQVYNGALAFSVIPTRGMGLWKGQYLGDPIGWRSPITDGPVHPAHVDLAGLGGLGWLGGFDEWLVRCGLEHNGPPYQEGSISYPLHGRIANIPAHFVAVHIEETPPYAITIEGHVTETRLFGPRLRMVARLMTTPGSHRLVVRDEFTNLSDTPGELQILYHWNFGPPHLEEGARVVAPANEVAPISPRAAEGIGHYDVYGPPEPGYAEQVYLYQLHGDGPDGRTLAMLRNRPGDKAVVLRFASKQLPCFTVWKNTAGLADGYVTGLEPATNYPNPRPFEKSQGRVVRLDPGQTYSAETVFEALAGAQAVADVEAEIQALQGRGAPMVHPRPVGPFTTEK
ncbi:MAG: aldose 1-epimerase family protein [Isosphaeraceae bacterium]|nr:aldose 1-epimerase family protein [Isosphaeraceae bacterium]